MGKLMVEFSYQQSSDNDAQINVMPLIDIIFILLIFFMITAAITAKGISLDLPEAATAEKLPARSWEIVINEGQEIRFNGTPITLERLAAIMKTEQDRPAGEQVLDIILKADDQVPFGIFVTVMDLARENGLMNLVIATEPRKVGS